MENPWTLGRSAVAGSCTHLNIRSPHVFRAMLLGHHGVANPVLRRTHEGLYRPLTLSPSVSEAVASSTEPQGAPRGGEVSGSFDR